MLGRVRDVPTDPVAPVCFRDAAPRRLGVGYTNSLHTRLHRWKTGSSTQARPTRQVAEHSGLAVTVAWTGYPRWAHVGVPGDGTYTAAPNGQRTVLIGTASMIGCHHLSRVYRPQPPIYTRLKRSSQRASERRRYGAEFWATLRTPDSGQL